VTEHARTRARGFVTGFGKQKYARTDPEVWVI
jgi:hypothetical protein